jgi:response regulator of citrate/malate metabolism
MRFDRFKEGDIDPYDYDDEGSITPESLRLRSAYLVARMRAKLPRLTKPQAATVVAMLVAAYRAGEQDGASNHESASCRDIYDKSVALSRRGVKARRAVANQKRSAFLAQFTAATRKGSEVSVEKLAKQHGVSRATAYRYLTAAPRRGR